MFLDVTVVKGGVLVTFDGQGQSCYIILWRVLQREELSHNLHGFHMFCQIFKESNFVLQINVYTEFSRNRYKKRYSFYKKKSLYIKRLYIFI